MTVIDEGCADGESSWVMADVSAHEAEVPASASPICHPPLFLEATLARAAVDMNKSSIQAVLSVASPPAQGTERSPLHLVAVLDVSGSMGGQKLRLVVRTMLFVLQHLSDDDAVGLVVFDSVARVLSPMIFCDTDGRLQLENHLRTLQAGSQTNLSGGMLKGIELHRDGVQNAKSKRVPCSKSVVHSMFLLTDGQPNVGITDHSCICNAAQAALGQSADLQCTLSTFGFGVDHDGDLLQRLADLGRGIYSYVESEDQIGDAFGEVLGGLLSITHQNVRLILEPASGINVAKIHTTLPFTSVDESNDKNYVSIEVGDLFAEEHRDILVTFEVPEAAREGPWQIGSFWAKGFSVTDMNFEQTSAMGISIARLTSVDDGESLYNPTIEFHKNRYIATEAFESSRRAAHSGDLALGRDHLKTAEHTIANSPLVAQGDAPSVGLLSDVRSCLADLADDATYRAIGSKSLACAGAAHSKQRACAFADTYSTPTCRAMRADFKKHVTFDDTVKADTDSRKLVPTAPRVAWSLPQRYEVRSLIGSGSYGSVREAYDNNEQRLVAVKNIRNVFEDLGDCKRVLREISILAKLKHECVVQVYEVLADGDVDTFDRLNIVMEICDSDLKKLCRTDVSLTTEHTTLLFYNLLVGLNYIHSAGVYHRDLKPANCLVNQNCSIKICDFGLARTVGDNPMSLDDSHVDDEVAQPIPVVPATQRLKRHLTGHVVTRWYRAPEVLLLQSNYTEAIDMWGAGCVFAEILQMLEGTNACDRGPLFPGSSCSLLSPRNSNRWKPRSSDQISMIFQVIGTPSDMEIESLENDRAKHFVRSMPKSDGNGLASKLPNVDVDALDLLQQTLRSNPEHRITAADALEHKLFVNVRDPAWEVPCEQPLVMSIENAGSLDEPALRAHFGAELQRYM